MDSNWRKEHGETIRDFLIYLNKHSNEYILKGDTSLMMCYNLDRFSEDIDLDCTHSKQIKSIVDSYCEEKGYSYRVAKDTDTVKRFMINYGRDEKPLKIEVSYRKKFIDKSEYSIKNGINVYNIENICMMKVNAYSSRDKIRDLYDLTFICNNYWEKLPPVVKHMVRNCVEFKGLEQFDYLINQQNDELIDNNKLAGDFLKMYDNLGLMIANDEKEILTEHKKDEYIQVSKEEFESLKKSLDFTPDEYKFKNDSFILKLDKSKSEQVKQALFPNKPIIHK